MAQIWVRYATDIMIPNPTTSKPPTKHFFITGYLLVVVVSLSGCQHTSLAKSPLPVSVEPTASQYRYISYSYDDIKDKLPPCQAYHGKARPTPTLCLPKPPKPSTNTIKPKRHFFLLEDWF